MISKKEVKHIASLARLGLTEKELQKYQKELSKILDYIEKLKEVDVRGVEPMSHSSLLQNIVRKDVAEQSKVEELMELVPETKNDYIKVKPILNDET